MTAATPAAGDSWKSRLPARRPALPGCGVPCEPACSSCRPPSRARLSATWCCPSARPSPTPSYVGSCASHTAPLMSPCGRGRWLIGSGRRVVLCEGPLRDAVTLRRCILGDGHRRGAQADRCGRANLPRPPTTGTPDSWNRRSNGKSMQRRLGSPRLSHWGSYLPHSSGKAAKPPSTLAAEPHDGRSASGGHL